MLLFPLHSCQKNPFPPFQNPIFLHCIQKRRKIWVSFFKLPGKTKKGNSQRGKGENQSTLKGKR
ncbi:MAG: hypothetical protein C6I01_00465 [Epsilonproteobacteria bacterium]|nr:hypothetical protein [Campylobacterota bacterium]